MKNRTQAPLVIFVAFVALCLSSCDQQAPPPEVTPSLKEIEPTSNLSTTNLSASKIEGKLPDGKAALKLVASINIVWTNGNDAEAKQQLSKLVELHKSLSQTPVYENALVSADCELRLCNSIVPALINGKLSPDEAQSAITSITVNRFNNTALAVMLIKGAPDSKQARTLAAELNSGRVVNLIEASIALLQEQGASMLGGPTPDRLGEFLDKPDVFRAFQYNAMMGAKLDVAKVIAAYASAGGNLHTDDATLSASLLEKVPKLVNAPGAITNRPIGVNDVVHYLAKWRNGSFVK